MERTAKKRSNSKTFRIDPKSRVKKTMKIEEEIEVEDLRNYKRYPKIDPVQYLMKAI
jgi:hypothetical protein